MAKKTKDAVVFKMKPVKLKHFDGITWAVFNSNDKDAEKAKAVVLEKYGTEGWKKVEKIIKTGIMAVFNKAPIPETFLYACEVAKSADARQ